MLLFSEMEITLYGISALGFWLSQEGRYRCGFESAQDALASLAKPLHVSMRKGSRSGRSSHVEHAATPIGAGATIRVVEGLCVPTPELCFVQISASMPFHQAVKAGCALCSTFRFDPAQPVRSARARAAYVGFRPGDFYRGKLRDEGSGKSSRCVALRQGEGCLAGGGLSDDALDVAAAQGRFRPGRSSAEPRCLSKQEGGGNCPALVPGPRPLRRRASYCH